MKILFLLRHAKAVPGTGSLQDVDRSLSEQGRRQAERQGRYFGEQRLGIDVVLSSTALRARETTALFLTAAECVTEVRYDGRIYEASSQRLLEVFSELEADQTRVLLVGHNPVLEELQQQLTGRFESMPTGTLAKIDLAATDWTETAGLRGRLDWLIRPQELTVG